MTFAPRARQSRQPLPHARRAYAEPHQTTLHALVRDLLARTARTDRKAAAAAMSMGRGHPDARAGKALVATVARGENPIEQRHARTAQATGRRFCPLHGASCLLDVMRQTHAGVPFTHAATNRVEEHNS